MGYAERQAEKLTNHVKLCRKNLMSPNVKCCAQCPFEETIVFYYPDLKQKFIDKRREVKRGRVKR